MKLTGTNYFEIGVSPGGVGVLPHLPDVLMNRTWQTGSFFRLRPLIAVLMLTVSTALGLEPKAIVTGPKTVPSGSVVFLDGSMSSSDRPLKWKLISGQGALVTFDKGAKLDAYALLPALPDGVYRISTVAVGKSDDPNIKPDDPRYIDVDVSVIEFVVGIGPTPPVPPIPPTPPVPPTPVPPTPVPPTPTPTPTPSNVHQKMGQDYGKSVLSTYADTYDESAGMLAAGVSRQTVIAGFERSYKARRDPTYRAVAAEFAKIVPDDREPTDVERINLTQAWKDFGRGIREAAR